MRVLDRRLVFISLSDLNFFLYAKKIFLVMFGHKTTIGTWVILDFMHMYENLENTCMSIAVDIRSQIQMQFTNVSLFKTCLKPTVAVTKQS